MSLWNKKALLRLSTLAPVLCSSGGEVMTVEGRAGNAAGVNAPATRPVPIADNDAAADLGHWDKVLHQQQLTHDLVSWRASSCCIFGGSLGGACACDVQKAQQRMQCLQGAAWGG
eukprot:CAMPEP_0174304550 /NCGR_PEP_ID=MMETSP0809-20121228/60858_1 /TAXON_ID=73025 ORGANISM="Eutreptiella gymnastica-like, Strain CCMP1594" /NCGR_SAMPLE_ID=MMETSP0809 /ASSEMBLY_ACC=CAM_ASM_000658 /LENGTH=114 /DNA_ID=CAMNT_0015410809 /DNA_START=279 /DNA_END=624 /DNA_ORIENTATION=-